MAEYHSIQWLQQGERGVLRILDQRELPGAAIYKDLDSAEAVFEAIRDMAIRGAPAIGVAGAYGLALAAQTSQASEVEELRAELKGAAELLRSARPTAVNLGWALDAMLRDLDAAHPATAADARQVLLDQAERMAAEDVWSNRQIALYGLELVPQGARIIHHCNTGALATVDYGTALGVIRAAHQAGRNVFVYVDETRPRLQGARLTTWELQQLGVPHALIVDGASGYVMRQRGVDLALVGCDRVAANGDTANKVGTYNLALVCAAHGVPFYVAAPTSSIDLSVPNGAGIPIEERDPREVLEIGGERIAPPGTPVVNPAFDVTPAAYIRGFITEAGVAYPPFEQSLAEKVAQARELHANLAELSGQETVL
jgi:methylthioribose-1-phosphate isomerase